MSDLWNFYRSSFRLTGGLARMTGQGITNAVRLGQQSHERAKIRRAADSAAQGVIGPGDPAPPPGYDVLDYRGIVDARQLRLQVPGLPLGRLVDVHRGPQRPAYLPMPLFERHSCVIGPSGSGKTVSVIVPWLVSLLAAGTSVVTVDVKGDLLDEIQRYQSAAGITTGAQGIIWDYNSRQTHRWNFLREIDTEDSVSAAALSLLGRQPDNDSQPYFYKRDFRWLKALIRVTLEVAGSSAHPQMLLDLISNQDALSRAVQRTRARADLNDLTNCHPQDYSRDVSGLLNTLALFSEPSIARAVSVSDFTLSEVTRRPTLLVAVARLGDGLRGEQMSSLLLSQFSSSVLRRFGSTNGRPLAFIVDEAPRLKDRVDLEQLLSVARGARAGVCLAAQDVSQFGDEHKQSALLANCQTYVSMAGVSPASATYFSNRLGTRLRDDFTLTDNGRRSLFDGPQTTRQSTSAPVLGSREIMYPPWGNHSALIHCPPITMSPFITTFDR